MGTGRIINFLDTHVGQDQPLTNYNAGGSMYIRNWSGSARLGFLYCNRPVPLGVTVTKAELHFFGYAKTVSGSVTMYLKRLKQTVTFSKLNWNNRPTAFYTTTERSATKSGTYPDQTEWIVNVMSDVQTIADGNAWYGWQLRTNWATTTWNPRFMAANHPNPDLRPFLVVEWSDAPDTPTQLSPSSGNVISTPEPILRFDYTDVSGDTEIAAVQVQIDTNALFSSPDYDSGVEPVDGPQWDLTDESFTATEDTLYYWRVKVQDGAGLWSGWSAAASFVYKPLPVVTIDSPAEDPNDFVDEPTPAILWTTTGTQESYQLGLYRYDSAGKAFLVDSRPRTVSATGDGYRVPAGAITVKNATYRVDVRIYDGEDREAIPNGPAYTQVSRFFTYQYSALTAPVTNLEGAGNDPYPGVVLEWDRATFPDSWAIERDGIVIATGLDPDDDTFVSGIHHQWTDRTPTKGRAHTYSVQAISENKASASNPTVVVTNDIVGTWVMDGTDGGPTVLLVQDKGRTMLFEEQSATYAPLGATKVSLVTQGLRGYTGEIQGELHSSVLGTSETATQWRDLMLTLKSYAGQIVYLFIQDMTIPVVLQNVQVYRKPQPDLIYAVSFTFHQQGDLNFTPRLGG